MDFGIIDVVNPLDPSLGVPSSEAFEPARLAMGDTRRYADRMALVDMTPRGDLTSTAYALANPDAEYLVLQPAESADAFTVKLTAGTYAVEWFNLGTRTTTAASPLTVKRNRTERFAPPGKDGPWVLYLKNVDR
jgi:hypothetical protein